MVRLTAIHPRFDTAMKSSFVCAAEQFSETWAAFPPCHFIYPDCGMAAATKRMRCERGRISWRCASVAPRGDTYPRPTSGEDRAPLHGGATAEGPVRKWLRWGVRLIRSRSPLSLLVRERRATGASPSAHLHSVALPLQSRRCYSSLELDEELESDCDSAAARSDRGKQ